MVDNVVRFSFPTAISFGPGAIQRLPEYLQELEIHKPLLVTDPVLKATDVYGTTSGVLTDSGTPFAVFADVRPNPPVDDVERALDVYRSDDCDGVVGLGGGSTLDAAKVVRVLVANQGPLTRYDIQTGGNSQIVGPLPQ